MPEQVQENKDNIKVLAEYIKEVFNAITPISNEATSTHASLLRNWVVGTTTGFILDPEGKLFKIIGVSDLTVFIQYWASLPQGAQGATGATGAQGAKGDKGDAGVGFNNTTDINLVVGDPLSVTYDTEDGITITSQGGIEADGQTFTPTVENNVPLIAGNGLTMDATEDGKHVDVHLSAETQNTLARSLKTPVSAMRDTHIVAVDNTNAQTMLAIGNGLSVENGTLKSTGGSSTQKYLHTIKVYSGASMSASAIEIYLILIDTNSQAYNSTNLGTTLYSRYGSNPIPCVLHSAPTATPEDIRFATQITVSSNGWFTYSFNGFKLSTTTIQDVIVATGFARSSGSVPSNTFTQVVDLVSEI